MASEFITPTFDELLAEQEVVQAGKFQGRLLREYNTYLFPGQEWRDPPACAVTDLMRPYSADPGEVSLENVLGGLPSATDGQPIRWADMGGGRGLAMRQLAAMPRFAGKLAMTNVDLFDYGLDGLDEDDIMYLKDLDPALAEDWTRPTLIQADVESVQLPEPQDLMTSIESMQYLNNPLQAISSWYNQLKDDGLLMIATEDAWAGWIRYDGENKYVTQEENPAKHLMDALGAAAVNFGATDELDYQNGHRPRLQPDRTRHFVVQKKPGTAMVVNADVTEIWTNPYSYKAVYYSPPEAGGKPTVEIVGADTAITAA